MNASLIDAQIKKYQRQLAVLEERCRNLPPKQRAEFESAKNRFEQRLEAWRKMLGSDLASFESNVEEGFDELEAMALRPHQVFV